MWGIVWGMSVAVRSSDVESCCVDDSLGGGVGGASRGNTVHTTQLPLSPHSHPTHQSLSVPFETSSLSLLPLLPVYIPSHDLPSFLHVYPAQTPAVVHVVFENLNLYHSWEESKQILYSSTIAPQSVLP